MTNRMVGVARYVDLQFDPAIAHALLRVCWPANAVKAIAI